MTLTFQKSSAKFENAMEAINGIKKGVRDAVSRRGGLQSILPSRNFTPRKIIERGRKGKSSFNCNYYHSLLNSVVGNTYKYIILFMIRL